jgi:hypothetical protein
MTVPLTLGGFGLCNYHTIGAYTGLLWPPFYVAGIRPGENLIQTMGTFWSVLPTGLLDAVERSGIPV